MIVIILFLFFLMVSGNNNSMNHLYEHQIDSHMFVDCLEAIGECNIEKQRYK